LQEISLLRTIPYSDHQRLISSSSFTNYIIILFLFNKINLGFPSHYHQIHAVNTLVIVGSISHDPYFNAWLEIYISYDLIQCHRRAIFMNA
jgi:hypothetical protein